MALSPTVIGLFLIAAFAQMLGLALMPATQGLTSPWPTVGMFACNVFGLSILARLVQSGAPIGVLVPMLAASVPLMTIAVSGLVYHDPMPPVRIGLLIAACLLVGIAARL